MKHDTIKTVEQFQEMIEIMAPCMDDFLYIYDIEKDLYCISPNALERFRLPDRQFYKFEEIVSKFVYKEDLPMLLVDIEKVIRKENEFHNLEYRWLDKEGKPVWINCRGQAICAEDGTVKFLVGCINEIGRKQKADNISGLRSEASLFQEIHDLRKDNAKGFLIRIGIDDFKDINENHGMDYGDMILQKTAECIDEVILPGQMLFRIIADEFAVLDYTGRDVTEAQNLYKRIGNALNRFIQKNYYEVFYTVSAGIVEINDLSEYGTSELMKMTEFSLEQAKVAGKNQYYIYKDEDYDKFRRRSRLIQLLRKAVNNNFEGFEAHFQPIIDIKEHKLSGAETLLRFESEESGRVSPFEFIPMLEESGLIIPVGIWVLNEAAKACSQIQQIIPDFRISVNLSYVQVLKSDVLAEIKAVVKKYQLKPNSMMVELTESGLIEESPKFNRFYTGLKEQGILLALDDFGSGYSNFRYLYNMTPYILKIDRAFTIKAIQNEHEFNILRQMVEMTHGIDLKLCIEGVETRDELDKICEIGPDYIQGYYYGKPCAFDYFMENYVLNKNLEEV